MVTAARKNNLKMAKARKRVNFESFSVAVFTKPNGITVEELLAPYHEFECTGHNDEYVQNIDQLEEVKKEYDGYTYSRLKSPSGELYDPYDCQFYRDPTLEEKAELGPLPGSGCGKGMSWASRDWGDGLGYRPKIKFIPEGYEEVEVKASEIKSFREFVANNYGRPTLLECENPDIEEKHKYGWMRIDNNGEVIELIDRTNPNKKWDWWQVGGRWSGSLKLKSDATSGQYGQRSFLNASELIPENMVDSAMVKDIDFSVDEAQYKKNLRFWELIVEGVEPQDVMDMEIIEHNFYKPEYYSMRYNNKEDYARLSAEFSTFAVITPDGIWHEKGTMGWFACSSETAEEAKAWNKSFKENFIDTADPEWTLTVVDCHI